MTARRTRKAASTARGFAIALPKVDPERVAAVTRSATYGMSREKTLALWRNVISRFPREISYARQYVQELLLTESWLELDAFSKSAGRYRSDVLDLDYVDADLARLRLASAANRLARFEKRHGLSPRLQMRVYELCCLRLDFEAAEQAATNMRKLGVGATVTRRLVRRARVYQRARQTWGGFQNRPRDYNIFAINLDADRLRLERLQNQLQGLPHTRIPGVKGSYLPGYALRAVSHSQGHQQKGTMGCFLSHIVAWERVVSDGRTALVLEDDACVLAGLPTRLTDLPLPEDFDIVFVNERMLPADYAYTDRRFKTFGTSDVAISKPADWGSAGTDGYLISPAGAARLLRLIETDGIAGDVDWRLVSYSLSRGERAAVIKRGGLGGQSLEFHERFNSARRRLRSYALLPALVRQFAGGSVRLWDNELPHAHLAALKSLVVKRRGATP